MQHKSSKLESANKWKTIDTNVFTKFTNFANIRITQGQACNIQHTRNSRLFALRKHLNEIRLSKADSLVNKGSTRYAMNVSPSLKHSMFKCNHSPVRIMISSHILLCSLNSKIYQTTARFIQLTSTCHILQPLCFAKTR